MRFCNLQTDRRWDPNYNSSMERGAVKLEIYDALQPSWWGGSASPETARRASVLRKAQLSEKNRKRGRTNRRVKGK